MSQKRKAVTEFDARQFLSLEAEVDDDDESIEYESGEGDDLGDFLDFEPSTGDREATHAYLYHEYERAEREHEGWQGFIRRAEMRASGKSNSMKTIETSSGVLSAHGVAQVGPGEGDALVYRVPVKPGYEEAYAFAIFEKIAKADANARPAIRSVVGRTSLPGSILVEAQNVKAVYEICRGLMHVNLDCVCALPFEEAIPCLRERQTFTPHSSGWVHMKSGRYRGDTAYVANVDPQTLMPTLWLIPRLPTSPRNPSDKKRKREERPAQALFDSHVIQRRFGAGSVKKDHEVYVFKGEKYCDRFVILETESFVREDTLPTREELALFRCHPLIPSAVIQAAYNAIDASLLQHSDRVLIACGEYQGCTAVVKSIIQSTAEVQFSLSNAIVAIDCGDLRKKVQVGDEVKVVCGVNTGFVGWVVSTENGVLDLYNHHENKEIREQMQNVEFESPKFRLRNENYFQVGDEVKVTGGTREGVIGIVTSTNKDDGELIIIAPEWEVPVKVLAKDAEKIPAFGRALKFFQPHDPYRQYIGSHVVVAAHAFKQYRGVIRDTLNDGYVSVELEAMLRRVRIHISKLAFWVYGRWIGFSDLESDLPRDATRHAPMSHSTPDSSTSSLQYSPAWNSSQTPGPSTSPAWDPSSRTPILPSSQPSTPAWDPSSRTPIPTSSQPLTRATPLPSSWTLPVVPLPPSSSQVPWFAAPALSGKRLGVIL